MSKKRPPIDPPIRKLTPTLAGDDEYENKGKSLVNFTLELLPVPVRTRAKVQRKKIPKKKQIEHRSK